jgi:hypothetical protein
MANWTVYRHGDMFFIVNADDELMCEVPYTAESGDGLDPLNTAKGRMATLIAAAPELLEALEALAEYVDMPWDDSTPLEDIRDKALEAARAAIAKARGVAK